MSDQDDDSGAQGPESSEAGRVARKGVGKPDGDRDVRRARQLRANLRRRKSQKRARSHPAGERGDQGV